MISDNAMLYDDDAVDGARIAGYDLVQRELPTGELAWTFRRDDGAIQPRFLTEREPVAYRAERLRRVAVFEK